MRSVGMNLIWSRFLRSAYQRDPLTSFVMTVGAVDAAIGGLNEQWSLRTAGLGTVGVAIALRWWQQYRQQPFEQHDRALHLLPPQSSRPTLPPLLPKKTPPRGKR